jgi:hypothetical protein
MAPVAKKPAFEYEKTAVPFEERKNQSANQLIMMKAQNEADEFSFVNEHMMDEPSIHVRCINQLPNIMKHKNSSQQPLVTRQQNLPLVAQKDYKHHVAALDTAEKMVVSMMQDDTLMEPSCFFDENVCNTTILHKAHMVEKYTIPAKRVIQGAQADKCTERLNELIQKVKQDVTQSIILNQSRAVKSKCGISINNDLQDITNESDFPNVTNEELHISNMVTKAPQNGGLPLPGAVNQSISQQQEGGPQQ